jgi:molybdenum cofactor guanylyltransferase
MSANEFEVNLHSQGSATMKTPVSGIILAGGASRRMGQAKAMLPWGTSTLLEHLVHELHPRLAPLFVACEGQMSFPDFSRQAQLVFDPISHLGPLVGFSNGLKHVPADRLVFLTGCDFPFLQGSIVDFLLERLESADAVVVQWQGLVQPLAGLYHPRIAHTVAEQVITGKRSMMELLNQLQCNFVSESDWLRFDPSGQMLLNINTPEEYIKAHQIYLRSISSLE